MKNKEKILFLTKLVNDYQLYPDRIIISKLYFGYGITDFEKTAVITDKRTVNKLQKHFKEIIVVDIDGSGVVEFSEFDTNEFFLKTKWLTPEQACEYLQISISYLNQLVKEKKLKAYGNGKIRRFKLEDLDKFLEEKPKKRGKKASLKFDLV